MTTEAQVVDGELCLSQRSAAKFLGVTPQRLRQLELQPHGWTGRRPWYALDTLVRLQAARRRRAPVVADDKTLAAKLHSLVADVVCDFAADFLGAGIPAVHALLPKFDRDEKPNPLALTALVLRDVVTQFLTEAGAPFTTEQVNARFGERYDKLLRELVEREVLPARCLEK